MFWFCVLLTVVTYPIVCVGSFICGIFILILSNGYGSEPNPFVSPAKVYRFYRSTFEKWVSGLKNWYREESVRGFPSETTHYHPITGMRYRLRHDGRWEFKQSGLGSVNYPKDHKFKWEISGMCSGFIPTNFN